MEGGVRMTYSAMEISKYFINHNCQSNISNLKLQKMLFYAQMKCIQKYNEVLFTDKIEAWRHGPVVRSVYKVFKKYMSSAIPLDAPDFKDIKLIDNRNAKDILDGVLSDTENMDAWDLVDKTHETSAWKDNYVENCNNEITFLDMLFSGDNLCKVE